MAVEYTAEWDPKALKELRKLYGAVRLQFLRRLEEPPRVPGDALHDLKDCYKINLRGAGYRLVYRVEDERIVILVLTIGRRARGFVYEQAEKR